MGAQISVVKQPYAYFSKELVQQIDSSDVGLSTPHKDAEPAATAATSQPGPTTPPAGCLLGKQRPHSMVGFPISRLLDGAHIVGSVDLCTLSMLPGLVWSPDASTKKMFPPAKWQEPLCIGPLSLDVLQDK